MRHEAIRNLYPSVTIIDDTAGCFDETGNLVTIDESDVSDEIVRLQAIETDNEYKIERRLSYPSIANQLDMLWHAIDTNSLNKTSDFYTTIKAVKDAYPKSE
jgi:hypothetical protein